MHKILAVVRRVQQLPGAQPSKMFSPMVRRMVLSARSPAQHRRLLSPRARDWVVLLRRLRQPGIKGRVLIKGGQGREILTKGHGVVGGKVYKILVEKDTAAVTRGIRQRKTLILSTRIGQCIGITRNHQC